MLIVYSIATDAAHPFDGWHNGKGVNGTHPLDPEKNSARDLTTSSNIGN